MGKVIDNKTQGMGRRMKAGLVLLLTLLTSVVTMPRGAQASVAALNAWPATPQIVSTTNAGTVTGTVSVSAGSKRVMLVVVGVKYSATPATMPLTVTFGGKRVTQLQSNYSCPNAIWLGFINEADLAAASGTTLSVTNANTTNLTAMYASAAVFSGVDQTTPITGSNNASSGATAVTAINLPQINVKGTTTPSVSTALSFYMSNRLQSQTVDANYTQNVQYTAGANGYLAFNTITTPPSALTTTAPVSTTATASTGCAVDVSLTPDGVTGIGAIGSCGTCHGYPPVDGTARNTPAGQFLGSHNKHTGTGANQYAFVCTRCHRNNTSFNHANGRINMRVPINGTGIAIYNNVTSWSVTNTPTFGKCTNTYCHSNAKGGTTQTGDTRAFGNSTSLTWGTVNGPGGTGAENYTNNCSITCHKGRPSYTNYTGVITTGKKANAHGYTGRGATHLAQTCDVCHSSITTSDAGVTYAFTSFTTHANGRYNLKPSFGYVYNAKVGGTCTSPPSGCHGTAFWGGSLTCVNCHNVAITRTLGRPGTQLRAITPEFGQAYGHFAKKRTNFGPLTNAVCVVCHLEGYGYGSASFGSINPTYHKNGNIDLRDPVGSGETPITDTSGAAFTFQRFTTSYAAGTRTSNGQTNNTDIANVITQKFCLGCHRASGATNTAARISATSTAWRPWGFGNFTTIGNNYTVLNGAAVRGGLVNAFSQFSTGNSSVHPVRGPLNKDYPIATLLNAPYNINGRVATTGHTKTLSAVINCFDCHNTNTGALYTTKTVAAHGTNNTAQVRGLFYGSSMTLCSACHTGYTIDTHHPTGSAAGTMSGNGGEGMGTYCTNCHSGGVGQNATAAPARPIAASNFHGYNKLLNGSNWPDAGYGRPYAFFRNNTNLTDQRPYTASDITVGSPTCNGSGKSCANGGAQTYTPGGSY
ncbi:MAG TPA: hypothetical protein VI298_09445 [Geobacteraceae bacterium]